jgi:hypothetical protein
MNGVEGENLKKAPLQQEREETKIPADVCERQGG